MTNPVLSDKDLFSTQQARQLVERASQAEEVFRTFSQEKVDQIVAAMAKVAEQNARRLAQLAVEETGYGKIEDKTIKNLFSAVSVYNYIKDLKTCGVVGENKSKKVIDIAVPAGVIAAIIPSTNPTSTAIFKILCALKGRNAIVISPHPHAARCTIEAARVMYEAAVKAGAPEGCINWMDVVTIEGTTQLMKHKKTNLILATGGPGLVHAAYSSGKPAFGVGSGNVPAFIERSANIPKAVRDVIAGKTFDHGTLCSSEQSIVCDKPVEAQVLEELRKNKAYFLNDEELQKLNKLIQLPTKTLNPAIVGKSPQVIAQMAGFSVPPDVVCLIGRPGGVGRDYPLSMEKLSPILAFYVEDGWETGCRRCIEILSFHGLGHTMAIHSNDQRIIMEFALHKPAFRICVNTPATHGSVGLTTGVPPSMTLGCGAPGGNITSDNITPMHLINIKRLAFELRSVDEIRFEGAQAGPPAVVASPTIPSPAVFPRSTDLSAARDVIRGIVEEYLSQKKTLNPAAAKKETPTTYLPKSVEPPKPQAPLGPPVDFVCEDDVRRALSQKQKIVISPKTILTPSARELGEDRNVFVFGESH